MSAARKPGAEKTLRSFFRAVRSGAGKARLAFGTWAGNSRARKLGAAALASLLVLAAGSAFFAEYLRAAFSTAVPLQDETRRAVREKAGDLAKALEARLMVKGKVAGDAWTSAEILVALREAGGADRRDAESIAKYFRSVAGPECACWRKLPTGKFPNHVGVTSWTLWALACHGVPAHRTEIDFLLSAQGAEGGWPLFAGAEPKRFASTYATAAAILALHEQSALEKDSERRERIAAAVRRGTDWLKSRATAGRARWADYPDWPQGRREYLGLSGFVLFALHRVGAPELAALDRDWIGGLPEDIPSARPARVSGKMVLVGKRSYPDDTPHRVLPWTIAATGQAYRNASIFGRVRAARWLERALVPGAPVHAFAGSERDAALVAELLFALRSDM